MEDTLVSSRIPHAKKEAGVAVLKAIGSTTSELINCAFDYVIENHQLPQSTRKARKDPRSFAHFVSESTLDIDWGDDNRTYDDILRSGKVRDYESLD